MDIYTEPEPFRPKINVAVFQEVDAINRRLSLKEIPYKERRCDRKIKYKKSRLY